MLRVPMHDTNEPFQYKQKKPPKPVSAIEGLTVVPPKPDAETRHYVAAAEVTRDLQAWKAATAAWQKEFINTRSGADAQNAVEEALAFNEAQFKPLQEKYAARPLSARYLHDEGSKISNRSIFYMDVYAQMEGKSFVNSALDAEEQELRSLMTSPFKSDKDRIEAFNDYTHMAGNWRMSQGETPEAISAWRKDLGRTLDAVGTNAQFERHLKEDPSVTLRLMRMALGDKAAESTEDTTNPEAEKLTAYLGKLAAGYPKVFPQDQLQLMHNRAEAETRKQVRLADELVSTGNANMEACLLQAVDGADLAPLQGLERDFATLGRTEKAREATAAREVMSLAQPYLAASRFEPFARQRSSVQELFTRPDIQSPGREPAAARVLEVAERGLRERESRFMRDPAGYVAGHALLGKEGMSTEEFCQWEGISQEELITHSLRLQERIGNAGMTRVLPEARAAEIKDSYAGLQDPREKAQMLQQLTTASGKYAGRVLAEAGLPMGVSAFARILPELPQSETHKLAQAAESLTDGLNLPEARREEIRARVAGSPLVRALLAVDRAFSESGQSGIVVDEAVHTLESFVALGGNLPGLERHVALAGASLTADVAAEARSVGAAQIQQADQPEQTSMPPEETEMVQAEIAGQEAPQTGTRSNLEQFAHEVGVGTRGVVNGAAGAVDFVTTPARALLNGISRMCGGSPDFFQPLGGALSDALGLPQPETKLEEFGVALNKGGTEALFTVWAASALMTQKAAASTSNALWDVVNTFRVGPTAQVVSGAGSEVGLLAAQTAGAGPLGQIVASIAAGAAGGKIAPAGRARPRGAEAPAAAEAAGSKAATTAELADDALPALRTTNHETGVTGLPKANQAIMRTDDWQAAKLGTRKPAQRIVAQLWTPEKTESLRAKLNPGKETVFLSVPSTTRLNRIPDALGERLADEIGGTYVDVQSLYRVESYEAMKDIPKMDRPFAPRSYTMLDADAVKSLQGKQVVLTEDVITTGSSVRQFAMELRRQGVEVQTVAGLMGDARLDASPQLVSNLQRTLRNAMINVKGRDLTDVLSAGEIEAIIERINKTGGAHERAELAERIQGILHSRTAGAVEKHSR